MKKRIGFVSNSSSSSYICEVCGEEASGWDVDLSDYEMSVCQKGHAFCDSHMIGNAEDITKDDIIKAMEEFIERYTKYVDEAEEDNKEYWQQELEKVTKELKTLQDIDSNDEDPDFESYIEDYEVNDRYRLPLKYCPICNFKEVHVGDAYKYLLRKVGMTNKTLLEEVSKRFKSYSAFEQYLEEKQDG